MSRLASQLGMSLHALTRLLWGTCGFGPPKCSAAPLPSDKSNRLLGRLGRPGREWLAVAIDTAPLVAALLEPVRLLHIVTVRRSAG